MAESVTKEMVMSVDWGLDADAAVLIAALHRAGKIEIIESLTVTAGPSQEEQIADLIDKLRPAIVVKEAPRPGPTLPYWRQFERKRRVR